LAPVPAGGATVLQPGLVRNADDLVTDMQRISSTFDSLGLKGDARLLDQP
jgi:hypothetical protein